MKVHVDMNLCQSHGECVFAAPDAANDPVVSATITTVTEATETDAQQDPAAHPGNREHDPGGSCGLPVRFLIHPLPSIPTREDAYHDIAYTGDAEGHFSLDPLSFSAR